MFCVIWYSRLVRDRCIFTNSLTCNLSKSHNCHHNKTTWNECLSSLPSSIFRALHFDGYPCLVHAQWTIYNTQKITSVWKKSRCSFPLWMSREADIFDWLWCYCYTFNLGLLSFLKFAFSLHWQFGHCTLVFVPEIGHRAVEHLIRPHISRMEILRRMCKSAIKVKS